MTDKFHVFRSNDAGICDVCANEREHYFHGAYHEKIAVDAPEAIHITALDDEQRISFLNFFGLLAYSTARVFRWDGRTFAEWPGRPLYIWSNGRWRQAAEIGFFPPTLSDRM